MPSGRALEMLRNLLGDASVLTAETLSGRHLTDWSGEGFATPEAVLLPRTPPDVAAALAICAREGQPLAIQGGLTGLAGGANPQPGEFVLSLAKLNNIETLDEMGGTVIGQAGVNLGTLQDYLGARGWHLPLDLGARGSCQIGGNAATNAGGNRVLRYGMMRDSVLGLEVALPDGTLLTMLNQVIKNNAGLDLKHLFIGSEGTLGVITRLSLKLIPLPNARCTALCALPSFQAATHLLREARRSLPELASFELMWDGYVAAALSVLRRPSPFHERHAVYVLIETLGTDEPAMQTAIERCLEHLVESRIVEDAVIAKSLEQAKSLWDIREAASELMSKLRPFIAFDVSAPLREMEGFVNRMSELLQSSYPTQQHLFFGHLGDGNLHLLTGPYADDAALHDVKMRVYAAVEAIGGSISAETGIGFAKKEFLARSRSPDEMALMRALKNTVDPQHILNRGRIFD
jgi:FAD/FMN-containing dehydrogenase